MVLDDRLGARWATNTNGVSTSIFAMQGDGNLVLYSSWGAPLWATMTFCR